MKKITPLFALVILFINAIGQKSSYVLKGQLDKGKYGMVYIGYPDGENYVHDSASVVDGSFEFKGKMIFPSLVGFTYAPPGGIPRNLTMEQFWAIDSRSVYVDVENVSIKGSTLKTASVTAGKTQREYEQYEQYIKPWKDSMRVIEKAYGKARRENNNEEVKRQDAAMHAQMAAIEEAENKFIGSHTDSYVSLNIINMRKNNNRTASMEPMLNLLSQRLQKTPEALSIRKKLADLSSIEIGKPAPDFTQDDVNGKPISLSSLRGKFLLIDFWASWCGPCRLENPNVVKTYNEFKDKGFEILGVSLDDNKDNWLKAISKDGLTWLQVSDLKGWRNAVAGMYNIKAVPANVLLDPSGVIIARDLKGEMLKKKLEEVMSAQGSGRQRTVTF